MAPMGASRRPRRPRRRVRPSSFRATGNADRCSGIASRRKKVRAVLICALHQTSIPALSATRRRCSGCSRNQALRGSPRAHRSASAFSISRFIPAFFAFFSKATSLRRVSSGRWRSASHVRGAGAAEKKFAKLLTQKKCVASFRRNASQLTSSDPNAPPSALRTRRSRPNGSGPGRAVRLPLPQCRGPFSGTVPSGRDVRAGGVFPRAAILRPTASTPTIPSTRVCRDATRRGTAFATGQVTQGTTPNH